MDIFRVVKHENRFLLIQDFKNGTYYNIQDTQVLWKLIFMLSPFVDYISAGLQESDYR